jgi:hypothetical protein
MSIRNLEKMLDRQMKPVIRGQEHLKTQTWKSTWIMFTARRINEVTN